MLRGRPLSTPPSAMASIMRNTYAGPLPLRPVTASSSFSATWWILPRAKVPLGAYHRSLISLSFFHSHTNRTPHGWDGMGWDGMGWDGMMPRAGQAHRWGPWGVQFPTHGVEERGGSGGVRVAARLARGHGGGHAPHQARRVGHHAHHRDARPRRFLQPGSLALVAIFQLNFSSLP